jgi:hypothetical protein
MPPKLNFDFLLSNTWPCGPAQLGSACPALLFFARPFLFRETRNKFPVTERIKVLRRGSYRLLHGLIEKQLEMTAQVIYALGRDRGAVWNAPWRIDSFSSTTSPCDDTVFSYRVA